jgi:hypothetical protein
MVRYFGIVLAIVPAATNREAGMSKADNDQALLKERELAQILNLSVHGLARLRQRGQVPFFQVGAKPRYSLRTVLAFCRVNKNL